MTTRLTPLFLFLALLVRGGTAHAESGPPPATVDLNQASGEQLQTVPGIGPSKAAKILEYRQKRPFRTVEELVRVKGFGRKTLVRLRPFLSVDGTLPITGARPAPRTTTPPQATASVREAPPTCPACQCICSTAPPATTPPTSATRR